MAHLRVPARHQAIENTPSSGKLPMPGKYARRLTSPPEIIPAIHVSVIERQGFCRPGILVRHQAVEDARLLDRAPMPGRYARPTPTRMRRGRWQSPRPALLGEAIAPRCVQRGRIERVGLRADCHPPLRVVRGWGQKSQPVFLSPVSCLPSPEPLSLPQVGEGRKTLPLHEWRGKEFPSPACGRGWLERPGESEAVRVSEDRRQSIMRARSARMLI